MAVESGVGGVAAQLGLVLRETHQVDAAGEVALCAGFAVGVLERSFQLSGGKAQRDDAEVFNLGSRGSGTGAIGFCHGCNMAYGLKYRENGMEINWPVFQATAALLGGSVASGNAPPSLGALAEFADKRFVNLYRALERIAARIEAGEGVDPSQSATQT